MDLQKRQKLEPAGWSVGNAEDFLNLDPIETEIVELKLAISARLKELRLSKQLSQKALAKKMKSSQSRIAKMESADSSVSIDLLIRALLYTGATRSDLFATITSN